MGEQTGELSVVLTLSTLTEHVLLCSCRPKLGRKERGGAKADNVEPEYVDSATIYPRRVTLRGWRDQPEILTSSNLTYFVRF